MAPALAPWSAAKGNQDHTLSGSVASDFGLPNRVSQSDILKCAVAKAFSVKPVKDCNLGTAVQRHVVPERPWLEYRCTATYLDRMRHRASPRRGRSIDWPSVDGQHARDRQRAGRRGAAAASSCARKVNRHNAIRETRDKFTI